jgi:hypothetical protein
MDKGVHSAVGIIRESLDANAGADMTFEPLK